MKKIISTLAMASSLAVVANADFARVEIGGGAWSQDPTGTIVYQNGSVTGSYVGDKTATTSAYAWALVKHPIPIIPNLRVEYSEVEEKGAVSGTFKDFTATGITTGSFAITEYDVIPYYNLLDNTFWITLDVGVDVKVLDTTFKADGVTINGVANQAYEDSATLAVPLGYLRGRVQIPGTGLGVEADVKYVTYSGSTLSDMRAKVDYTFEITPVIQPGIEVGYRIQNYTLDDDDTKIDMKFAGIYAGIMLRF